MKCFTTTSRKLWALCIAVLSRPLSAKPKPLWEDLAFRTALDTNVSAAIRSHFNTALSSSNNDNVSSISRKTRYDIPETFLPSFVGAGLPQYEQTIMLNSEVKNVMRLAVPFFVRSYIGRLEEMKGHDMFEELFMRTSDGTTNSESNVEEVSFDVESFSSNLDNWMELIDSDYETVATSFSTKIDFDKFIDLLKSPPPETISEELKERFFFLFDEFVKTLMYFWFQVHFLDDGEQDGNADLNGYTWEECESLVVRQNRVTVMDYGLGLRVGFAKPTNRVSEINWIAPLGNLAVVMMRASTVPSVDTAVLSFLGAETQISGGNDNLASSSQQKSDVKKHNEEVKKVMRAFLPPIIKLRAIQLNCGDKPLDECELLDDITLYSNENGTENQPSYIQSEGWSFSRVGVSAESTVDENNVDDGELQNSIDSWFDAIGDRFDSQEVIVSFASELDLDVFINRIKRPAPALLTDDQKQVFMYLFDKVFKEALYFWFQLHFLGDDEQDGIADFRGMTWEEMETRILRSRYYASSIGQAYEDWVHLQTLA